MGRVRKLLPVEQEARLAERERQERQREKFRLRMAEQEARARDGPRRTPSPPEAPTPQVAPAESTPDPLPEVAPTLTAPPTPQVGGFWSLPNDVTDNLWRKIGDPYAQSVLIQLLRLSWGHHKDTCLIGLPKLAERCGFHVNQARKGKRILIALGVIAEAGEDNTNAVGSLRGTRYRILLKPPPTVRAGATAAVSNKSNNIKTDIKGALPRDFKDCPACLGTGFVYPEGYGGPVKRCLHD